MFVVHYNGLLTFSNQAIHAVLSQTVLNNTLNLETNAGAF